MSRSARGVKTEGSGDRRSDSCLRSSSSPASTSRSGRLTRGPHAGPDLGRRPRPCPSCGAGQRWSACRGSARPRRVPWPTGAYTVHRSRSMGTSTTGPGPPLDFESNLVILVPDRDTSDHGGRVMLDGDNVRPMARHAPAPNLLGEPPCQIVDAHLANSLPRAPPTPYVAAAQIEQALDLENQLSENLRRAARRRPRWRDAFLPWITTSSKPSWAFADVLPVVELHAEAAAATPPPALLQWSHGHAARPPD